jgi:hypothetical protein
LAPLLYGTREKRDTISPADDKSNTGNKKELVSIGKGKKKKTFGQI